MPLFHVWFATKRRKWLLQDEILEAAKEEIASAAQQHDIRLLEYEAVVDHVHLLLELENADQLPRAMNYLKGASARRIFQRLPSIKLDAHINSFWQAKYGYKPVSPGGEHGVRDYIRTQWDRLEKYVR